MKHIVFFLFFFQSLNLTAQVLPKEGSKLNYRLIGFTFSAEQGATGYSVEIAKGTQAKASGFKRNIVVVAKTDSNRLMLEVPAFGEDYTWRVVYAGGIKTSPFYHFTTLSNSRVDKGKFRLRILQSSDKYKDMYVALDGGGVFYDHKGAPITFLPEVNGLGGFVQGMNFTADGTITFLYAGSVYETNLNGDILWKAPVRNQVKGDTSSTESIDIYHHDLIKLNNGHYMVLGSEFLMSSVVTVNGSNSILLSKDLSAANGSVYGRYSTIIEFDKKGNVIWSWKDSKNLIGTDFDYFTDTSKDRRFDPHANSFFFDEKARIIYVSYKNLNRIIKIQYPGGKIESTYGERYKEGLNSLGRGFFCNPHSVRRSTDGLLYYFNNNSCKDTDSLPTLVMLREPGTGSDSLKKVWEYTCTVEEGASKKLGSGGGMVELTNHSFLVCMGNQYSKVFIIDRDKKIEWSALHERYLEKEGKWNTTKQYRANIIGRKELERMIWAAEGAKE